MMAQYRGVPLGELSPHVYAIAEQVGGREGGSPARRGCDTRGCLDWQLRTLAADAHPGCGCGRAATGTRALCLIWKPALRSADHPECQPGTAPASLAWNPTVA